jgi:two-component system phosphate regulon sensor histidine kinase PhoR
LRSHWASHLLALTGWLLGAVVLGLITGGIAWWLVGALAAYAVFTLRNVYLLARVISGGPRLRIFGTRGLWPELVAGIDKIRAKSRGRKLRYHRLLREVSESTGALSDAGIILNPEKEILWFNTAATRLLGLDPARDIGNRIDNFIRHPDFVQYLEDPAGKSITIPSPTTELGFLLVQLIPYGREHRLAIVRDVTHERRLEQTRRDFVANASHELRSPLTVISGYLDTLAEAKDPPESWRGPINEMVRQANRMTQILRDLIELTRLESETSKAKYDFADVADILRGIVHELEARAERPKLTLRIESDAALLGSESELHSIFYNVIHNAVRFTPPTGSVDVSWGVDDAGGVFTVRDTGIGIPAELIPRITERFYRVDPGRSRATGGTGLGLAIVKHALQRHNGTLTIQSREGEGSTFTCHFSPARLVYRGGASKAVV